MKMMSIIHPSKLHQKNMETWQFVDIDVSMKFRHRFNMFESVGITEQNWFLCQPKIIVVYTLNLSLF